MLGFVLLAWLGAEASWWPVAASAALLPAFGLFSWELLVRRRLLAALQRGLCASDAAVWRASVQSLGAALALVAGSRSAAGRCRCRCMSPASSAMPSRLWLTLYLMGAATGFAAAMMLESLSFAARSAAFLIPSGWGAQEATLMALAAVAGLSPDNALALGLVKRAREFAVGLPGLAAWGMAERRNGSPPG